MKTMYRTTTLLNIEAFKVTRETAKQVCYTWKGRERREAKRSDWQNWFDTWKEAHQFLLEQARQDIGKAKDELRRAHNDLVEIESMKPD
jgi:hypothetical protein